MKFLAVSGPGLGPEPVVWAVYRVDAGTITRLHAGATQAIPIPAGDTPGTYIQKMHGGAPLTISELQTPPSKAFPRIARPRINGGTFPEEWTGGFTREMASLQTQLGALTQMLLEIFRVAEPAPRNLGTYGHEIRNLLLLACTEVETQCRGILRASHYPVPKPNRTDYVKLEVPLRLSAYEVTMPRFPELPGSRPFAGWASGGTSLPWYDDYNAVKHNREDDFEKATLENAVNSLCGLAVVAQAQYGSRVIDMDLPAIFHIDLTSPWEPGDWYFVDTDNPNSHELKLSTVDHPFP